MKVKDKIRDHLAHVSTEEFIIEALAKQVMHDRGSVEQIKIGLQVCSLDLQMSSDTSPSGIAQNVVNLLLGADFDFKPNADLLKAVFIQENRDFKIAFIEALQKKSDEIFNLLPNPIYEIVMANILALYPFGEPETGTILHVPQKIQGTWHKVPYIVEKLTLNPDWLGGSIPAFGLVPQKQAAERVLLFRGTPQPTGSGFLAALLADSIPGYTVGDFIFSNFAKKNINAWVRHSGSTKVKIYGQSLGGSFALLTLASFPEWVSEVYVFGSPSLWKGARKAYEANCKDHSHIVNIYWNHKDFVPLNGSGYHPNWNIYKVFTPKNSGAIISHASIISAHPGSIFLKIDAKADSNSLKRKIANVFFFLMNLIMLPPIVALIALKALKMGIINLAKIFRKKSQLARSN